MITVDFARERPRLMNRSWIGSLMVVTWSAKSKLTRSRKVSSRTIHDRRGSRYFDM
jgi:hypothetical protein